MAARSRLLFKRLPGLDRLFPAICHLRVVTYNPSLTFIHAKPGLWLPHHTLVDSIVP